VNWEQTNALLDHYKRQFVIYHDIGEKNWTDQQRDDVRELRAKCVNLGQVRYEIARGR